MASPWKFISRLMSSRRQKGQGDEHVDGLNLDEPGIASSAKLLDKGSLDHVDPTDDPAAPYGVPGQALDHHQNTVVTDGSEVDDVSPTQFSAAVVITVHGASNVEDVSEATLAKRKRRSRTAKPVLASSKASPAVMAASDDEISLDNEIRALRGQLVRKLRLQNAQLMKMLNRFER